MDLTTQLREDGEMVTERVRQEVADHFKGGVFGRGERVDPCAVSAACAASQHGSRPPSGDSRRPVWGYML